jgi:hypothetical protein
VNQQPAEQDSSPYWAHSTTSTSDCRLVDDAIDEYALGIADPSQQIAIERHLSRCKRCSDLIASYQRTVATLAFAVPLVTPPARARTAVLARVAATTQSVAPPASVFSGSLESFRTPTLPSANAVVAPKPVTTSDPSAWWRVYAAPLATLPLVLALGLIGAWGFNNYAKLHDANGVIAMQDAEIAGMSDQIDPEDPEFVKLAISPMVKRYNLTSETGSQSATLAADPISGQAALQVEGLEAGYYSVLVQMRDGTMVQKAVFKVGNEGTASTAVDLGDALADFQSVHIRATDPLAETDIAVDDEDVVDVLIAVMGPNINQDSGTGIQGT